MRLHMKMQRTMDNENGNENANAKENRNGNGNENATAHAKFNGNGNENGIATAHASGKKWKTWSGRMEGSRKDVCVHVWPAPMWWLEFGRPRLLQSTEMEDG